MIGPQFLCVIMVATSTVYIFIVAVAVCEDKEETRGCESDSGPSCFSLPTVCQVCPCFVRLDITHIWNGV